MHAVIFGRCVGAIEYAENMVSISATPMGRKKYLLVFDSYVKSK